MVVTKKLKELTAKELNACGWIERIAYRGNENWTMYDFEAGDFNKIKQKNPEVYDRLMVTMGKKWFALYKEDAGIITLLDIAKMDIGKGQEDAKRQIQDFVQEIVDSGKFIFVIAKEDTSYFTFVKAAAEGQIEIYKDEKHGVSTRDMIFIKADGEKDLEEQKKKYQEKLAEFEKNKDKHKESRTKLLEHFIKDLEAEIGAKELSEIIDRN